MASFDLNSPLCFNEGVAHNILSKRILTEKTLGEKLRTLRRRRRLTLEQAEDETKVRMKYLEANQKKFSH